ncbi:tetratricopeptide repeat protein [Streptomyces sp. NPDC048330]|uniref:tetratricopeptide repeat protein n=1 Tax=Streptomyces sp. NPDC048330 TaxID=3365533 RepID=UPI00371AC9D5
MAAAPHTPRPSMRDLIQRRRRAGFLGRGAELDAYRRNFALGTEDPAYRFLFHVRGNAGIGKTSLLQELERIAREHGAVTARTDDSLGGAVEVMAAVSAQSAELGRPLKAVDRLLHTYRQRRHEAESALGAPGADPADPGAPTPAARATAQAALTGLGMLPVVGALAGALDPGQVAEGADRLRTVLSARLRSHDDVQLVLDPLSVLTPVFVTEVGRIAEEVPWVALFLDTYERTAPFLDRWLRDLLAGERYGALPGNVVVTLAGQRSLEPATWADWADLVVDLPLAPFSETETRTFLSGRGVHAEPVVQDVLRLSRGLPVLVSTLAESAAQAGAVDDPSTTAVERFLRWEADPVRRAAALAGALPRHLDEDVFRAVAEEPGGDLFGWLRALPFVDVRGDGARYHEVVRAPMLRLQRTTSADRWRAAHERLARCFTDRRETESRGLGRHLRWGEEGWRAARLEEAYHLMCANPREALPAVLRDGIDACDEGPEVARRWAATVGAAGEDGDATVLREWGTGLLDALRDQERGTIAVLGMLLGQAGLTDLQRTQALAVRGQAYRRRGEYTEAFADFDRAVELSPRAPRPYTGRAVTHRVLGDFDRALEDHDRACALAPDGERTLGNRGETYRLAGRLDEALADFDGALGIAPATTWMMASRADVLRRLGRPREALVDLDRALALEPDYVWALVRRSRLRRALGDADGGVVDLDRAQALSPDDPWLVGERGETLRERGRYAEAVAQYDRALALDPDYTWALGSRALAWYALGRGDLALADLDRALGMDPEYAWARARRAEIVAGITTEGDASTR